jgi:hypothetical protein
MEKESVKRNAMDPCLFLPGSLERRRKFCCIGAEPACSSWVSCDSHAKYCVFHEAYSTLPLYHRICNRHILRYLPASLRYPGFPVWTFLIIYVYTTYTSQFALETKIPVPATTLSAFLVRAPVVPSLCSERDRHVRCHRTGWP